MLKWIVRGLFRVLFRIKVRGDAAAFRNERTLIVANHESFLDGLVLALFLPVEAVFVVHTTVAANPFFKLLLTQVPHLAVDATNALAMKAVVKLLESGRPVAIFPEGRLTVTGSLMKVYDGAAFAAARTGATVVPVRIEGAGRSYFGRLAGIYPLKLFPRITVSIQPRRRVPMPELPSAKARRRRAGDLMRRILLDMLVATRPQTSLLGAFLDAKATFGSRYRLIEDVRMVEESYGSLLRMALGIGRMVSRHSMPGEALGMMLPNMAPALAAVIGFNAVRRVPAMINYTAGAEGIRAACVAARVRTILTSRLFLERAKLEPLVQELRELRFLCIEDFAREARLADKLWVLTRALAPRLLLPHEDPESSAVILFTSGSEGRPKGVVHTHASLLANVAQVRAMSDFSPLDKFMLALPLFHSFGLTCGVLLPLIAGCRVFLYPSPIHYRVIPELVYDRNCTVLFGTSTFLGNYAKHAHAYDFGRLRYVVAGAEKLSEDVRRTWIERFGIRILEGYGVTECAPVISVNVPMACRTGSVGQLVPLMEHRLEPVPGIDAGGVLHVKGPNVMHGYLLYDNPGTVQPLGDGWYSTGDIVEVDAEDFLHIRGRVKRFAKIAGEMISLEVVERIAWQAAPGAAHAATTRADSDRGEALILYTTSPGLTREALIAAARGLGASELSVPRLIRPVDSIPLLGTGKTDYVSLKKMAQAQS